jgi:hypothetical protein
VLNSENGLPGDPQADASGLVADLQAPAMDIAEALDELKSVGVVQLIRGLGGDLAGIQEVWPEPKLFLALDKYAMPWNPSEDAVRIAVRLLNNESRSSSTVKMAQSLGWSPRRFNPALHFLASNGIIDVIEVCGTFPFQYPEMRANIKTRRFVRDRE